MKSSRIHRLLKLITMLQTGKRYSSSDLMREFKIGRRTLYGNFNMLKVAGVNEIAWWIPGYGKEAVVQEPAKLKKIIADHIRRMAQQYKVQ